MGKLVWQDGNKIKAYRGKIIKEDEFFIWFLTEEHNEELRVNKKFVISLESGGKKDDRDN